MNLSTILNFSSSLISMAMLLVMVLLATYLLVLGMMIAAADLRDWWIGE